MIRKAIVEGRTQSPPTREVAAYLPGNYAAETLPPSQLYPRGAVIIVGEDKAGWTLDGYVIPRLASGLLFAREV